MRKQRIEIEERTDPIKEEKEKLEPGLCENYISYMVRILS